MPKTKEKRDFTGHGDLSLDDLLGSAPEESQVDENIVSIRKVSPEQQN